MNIRQKADDMGDDSLFLQLLGEHVPVTLLLDLLAPPQAAELYEREGGRADWLRSPVGA